MNVNNGNGGSGAIRTALSVMDRILDRICHLSLAICGTALVVLTVIFGWLVFGRYVLNATPTWVEQVSLLLVALIGFLGASTGVQERSHLEVAFFREAAPRPVRRLMQLACYVIMAVFGAVMMLQSYSLVLFKWRTEIPLIHLPEGLRAVPLLVCGALCLIYSIGHIVHFFRGDEPDESLLENPPPTAEPGSSSPPPSPN